MPSTAVKFLNNFLTGVISVHILAINLLPRKVETEVMIP